MNEVLLKAILKLRRQLLKKSMKTKSCLAMSHTETKRATTKLSRGGQEAGEVFPKESVTPDGRPMICQEDN